MKSHALFLYQLASGVSLAWLRGRTLQSPGARSPRRARKLLECALSLLGRAPLVGALNKLAPMLIELSAADLMRFDLRSRQPSQCGVALLRAGRVGAGYR